MFSFFKLTSKPNQTKPNQTWVLSLLINCTGSTGGPALAAPVKNFMGRVGKSHFRFSRQLMKVCKKDWVEAGATSWGRVKILRRRVQPNKYSEYYGSLRCKDTQCDSMLSHHNTSTWRSMTRKRISAVATKYHYRALLTLPPSGRHNDTMSLVFAKFAVMQSLAIACSILHLKSTVSK